MSENDIYCLLKDNLVNQVHLSVFGGIRLQVKEEDVLLAAQLLIDTGFATKED